VQCASFSEFHNGNGSGVCAESRKGRGDSEREDRSYHDCRLKLEPWLEEYRYEYSTGIIVVVDELLFVFRVPPLRSAFCCLLL